MKLKKKVYQPIPATHGHERDPWNPSLRKYLTNLTKKSASWPHIDRISCRIRAARVKGMFTHCVDAGVGEEDHSRDEWHTAKSLIEKSLKQADRVVFRHVSFKVRCWIRKLLVGFWLWARQEPRRGPDSGPRACPVSTRSASMLQSIQTFKVVMMCRIWRRQRLYDTYNGKLGHQSNGTS